MEIRIVLVKECWKSYNKGKDYVKEIEELFSCFVSNGLIDLANMFDLYHPIWEPKSIGKVKACEIEKSLIKGLNSIYIDKKTLSSKSTIDKMDDFILFLENYLYACSKFPEALIIVEKLH